VFAARERPPRFIKVDVEGFEVEVLEGMRETLRDHAPVLVVEVRSRDLEQRCIALLEDAGYAPRVRRNAWWSAL
jgi:hypothetical protein